MIVVDASVFTSCFWQSQTAPGYRTVPALSRRGGRFLRTGLLAYEAMSAAIRFGVVLAEVWRILDAQRLAGFRLVEPTVEEFELAGRIASTGHDKSGYPHLYDSIYHAVAIKRAGTFVTADARHLAKAKQFGNISLLADWKR